MNTWPFPQRVQPVAPAPPLRPGAGLRLTATAMGFSYSGSTAKSSFRHPFKPALVGGGLGIALSRGYVSGRQPTIAGRPIAPLDGTAPPILPLDPGIVNELGESWICVEVHPDEKGELPEKSPIEIVQRKLPRSLDRALGRHELCVVIWRDRRVWQVHEIVHFNLDYARVLPPAGSGAVRHLFT